MAIQKAAVYYNNQLAGYLTKKSQTYIFTYDDEYIREPGNPPISISFPKRSFLFSSKHLFPFFYGLLAEGEQKEIQCLNLKIKGKNNFRRLINTAGQNTIGAITVREINDE